jgi:hypothetical protein
MNIGKKQVAVLRIIEISSCMCSVSGKHPDIYTLHNRYQALTDRSRIFSSSQNPCGDGQEQ